MSALQFCNADENLRGALHQRMKEILTETGSHNAHRFSATDWNWQYAQLPSGEAQACLVMSEGIIGGYYHIPYYKGRVDGKPATFAMIQDVAVSPFMRGQGVFRQLAEYANAQIDQRADVVYTFPNHRSIHTFLKYNQFTQLATLDAFLLPLKSARVIQARKKLLGLEYLAGGLMNAAVRIRKVRLPRETVVVKLDAATPELTALYARHAEHWQTGIDRSAAYLQWRFFDKPGSQYTCLAVKEGSQLRAAAFFKADTLMGSEALLLMDWAFAPGCETHWLGLIQAVKQSPTTWFEREPALLFTAGMSPGMHQLRRVGFFKVPERLTPRPLHLLVRDVKTGGQLMARQQWHVTLADWDVL